ncbi:anti-CBASS protein Acb1 family protein [Coralloluteibacterium thermophilus]|uniref:Anti-CBASS protein Acb1 n=1 Tax=Coralloluteibacterium thermophilum TaxID=2707049 RepID=A0ABV9NL82_9GAMM
MNLVANLGTGRDKAAHSRYGEPTLTEEEAVNAYRSAWLPRKIVDIPAMDACRKWRSWNAESEQVSALEAEESRLGVRGKLLDAFIKARLFGGAALYIGTGDSDPSKPLNPERVRKGGVRHLNVLTRRVLQAGEIDRDPESPGYGLPASYKLSAGAGMLDIHPSRLVILRGAELPDAELAPHLAGWGDSVLTAIYAEILRADSTSANIASLVFEAKIDVIKIPGFMSMMADPAYEKQVLDRLRLAAMAKGINGTLVLDKEEEFEQKTSEFGSLRDVLLAFMQLVSGAADIPVTRLLGQSPGGLNASGESDIRNYYDRIQSIQELELEPAMEVLDECLIRSALGTRPPEVFYTWRSLWQTSEKERADIVKTTAESIKVIADTRLIPDEVLSKVAVNMLTESGGAPGLESQMAEWLAENPDGIDPDGEEARAAAALEPKPGERENLGDAAPRSLYVRRDVLNVGEIRAWAESQGIPDLADDLHVTVVYSRQPFDWIKAGNAREWNEDGRDKLIIPEGGPRAVEPLGGMSAVILFASSQLAWRHEEIIRAGASHDFPDYTPHISLTKSPVDLSRVEPYRGRIVLGPEIFEEIRED